MWWTPQVFVSLGFSVLAGFCIGVATDRRRTVHEVVGGAIAGALSLALCAVLMPGFARPIADVLVRVLGPGGMR